MQPFKIMNRPTARVDESLHIYLRDISREPMLTPDEEAELGLRIRQGDAEAVQRLVRANLRFVVSVAKQYQNQGLSLIDLISEGNLGLMKAASRFDDSRGFKFISYAVWWIRQSILHALAEKGRMVRLPANQIGLIGKIQKAMARFEQDNMRRPTAEELSVIIEAETEKIDQVSRMADYHVSIDAPAGEDEDTSLANILPSALPATDSTLDSESLAIDLGRALSRLKKTDREILKLSFGIGCPEQSLEEISLRFNISRERVRQIRERALRDIRRHHSSLLRPFLGN